MQRTFRVRMAVVSVVAISTVYLALAFILSWIPFPPIVEVLPWVILSLISGLVIVRLPVGGATTSIGEIVDLAAFATVGPLPILISNMFVVAWRNRLVGRVDLMRNAFNMSQLNAAGLTAYLVMDAMIISERLSPSLGVLTIFILGWVVYSAITTGLVSLVVSLSQGSSALVVWSRNYGREALISLASAPLAMIMAGLYVEFGMFPTALMAFPLMATNTLLGYLIERERMRAIQSRERQLASMGRATSSVLHEIARPLNRILMIADDAQERSEQPSKALDSIIIEARRASLIADKLFHSMRVRPDRTLVSVRRLLEGMQQRSELEGIELSVEVEASVVERAILVDGTLVITALVNLLMNAWQSQGALGGPIVLRAEEIRDDSTMDEVVSNEALSFMILDRGAGFSPDSGGDMLDALFSTKERGMGMGLFLVNQIAAAHGGTLSARNRDDGGAEFRLVLPVRER